MYRLSILCVFIPYHIISIWVRVRVMMLNATFYNISVISWQSVLLMEETWVTDVGQVDLVLRLSDGTSEEIPKRAGMTDKSISTGIKYRVWDKTTDLSQVTDKLYHIMSRVPHAMNGVWTFVVIYTDCIGSYKCNSHTITIMTASLRDWNVIAHVTPDYITTFSISIICLENRSTQWKSTKIIIT
jgi:hypothetical protein